VSPVFATSPCTKSPRSLKALLY